MDIEFDEYLAKGTEKILEFISSTDILDEEKEVIVSAFSEELMNNIGDTNKLQDFEYKIYSASLNYLDENITNTFSNNQASYSDYENAIKCCSRAKEILQLFGIKKWNVPRLDNSDLEKCELSLRTRQESTSISSKIIEEDRRIDDLIGTVQTELSVNVCDTLLGLLNELANDLSICKQRKVSAPKVNNQNTRKIVKKVLEIRKIAERKEDLHQSMYDIDLQIDNILSMTKTSPEQWQEVINLNQEQATLIADCSKKHWPMPSLRYLNTNELITKYKHYLLMNELDKSISSNRALLTSSKQYKTFFGNCTQLANCIETCRKNDWNVPDLVITDPIYVSEEVREEKKKKDRKKKIKYYIVLGAIGVVVIISLIVFCVNKYKEGKVQIPFNSSYVNGKSLSMIYDELDKSGFENIVNEPDTSGWLDSSEVISVSIDNQEKYNEKTYKKSDVNVVITYSSEGRIYVTDLLKDWKSTDYLTVVDKLREAGFTNLTIDEIDTEEKELDQLTKSLELNGMDYTNEHCYIPANAPIVVSYYNLKIRMGNNSDQFVGQNYETVVTNLEESGFTNVQTEVINTGWAKGNSVIGVYVNNADSYDSNSLFDPDERIVVKYSSNDRIDISDLVQNLSTEQYSLLQMSLKSKGFTNITTREKVTDNKVLNQLVASITINNQQFSQGDCYVQKSTPIVIEYYLLEIIIGQKSSSFTENKEDKYSSVVSSLKDMGFTNITVYRNNDLFNGWITKEGSIESITINGRDSFEATDIFYYDTPIVIVVNTFKDKGCEDIRAVIPVN